MVGMTRGKVVSNLHERSKRFKLFQAQLHNCLAIAPLSYHISYIVTKKRCNSALTPAKWYVSYSSPLFISPYSLSPGKTRWCDFFQVKGFTCQSRDDIPRPKRCLGCVAESLKFPVLLLADHAWFRHRASAARLHALVSNCFQVRSKTGWD
jgi:hypothetical protein